MLIIKENILTYYSYPVVFNLGSEEKKSNTSGNIYQKLNLSNVLKHLNLDMNYFTEDIFILYKWQYNLKEDMTLFSFYLISKIVQVFKITHPQYCYSFFQLFFFFSYIVKSYTYFL